MGGILYRGLKLGVFAGRIARDYGAGACKQEHVVVARDANTHQRLVVHVRTAVFRMRLFPLLCEMGRIFDHKYRQLLFLLISD